MLVNKFLTKNKLEVFGAVTNNTREKEVRIHATIIKEFEKFIKSQQFNQNNLHAFENELRYKIQEMLKDDEDIKFQTGNKIPKNPYTQRIAEINTDPDYIDQQFGRAARNSTAVAAYNGHLKLG